MNSDPTPEVLITSMVSPWFWMISFTMDKPRPVPFLSFPRDRSVLKTFPDLFDAVFWDSDPCVLDGDIYLFKPECCLDENGGIRVAEFDGIVDQVVEHLLDFAKICVYHSDIFRKC